VTVGSLARLRRTNLTAYDRAGRGTVLAKLNCGPALAAAICIALGSMTISASAITIEVAKKCGALTAKAYPPRVPGNPAAGSANGTGQASQAYFRKCVANGGNIEERAPKEGSNNNGQSPNAGSNEGGQAPTTKN
jgi:hypothetical protein